MAAPSLPLLLAIAVSTAMALPRAYLRPVEDSDANTAAASGEVYKYNDSACKIDNQDCRHTGICRLENSGFVCCCDCEYSYCSRQPRQSKSQSYICGDDGLTYTSLCEYRRQQCVQNKAVGIKNKGKCGQTCKDIRRATQVRQATGETPKGLYVPTCNYTNQHLFRTTQCSRPDKLKCWCVYPGNNTAITEPKYVDHEQELDCDQELRMVQLRCNSCTVMRMIYEGLEGTYNYSEYYEEQMREPQQHLEWTQLRQDEDLVKYLFDEFDVDDDKALSTEELEPVSRWLGVSKPCILETLSVCDTDNDGLITYKEWISYCLLDRLEIWRMLMQP